MSQKCIPTCQILYTATTKIIIISVLFISEGQSCRMSDYLRFTIDPPRHDDIARQGVRRPTVVTHIPPPETKKLKTDCVKCITSRETRLNAITERKKTLDQLRVTQNKVKVGYNCYQ